MSFYRFGCTLCKIYCKVAYRVSYVGVENLPAKGGFVLASNHITALDPVLLGAFLKHKICFMAKEELFKNKFIAKVLKGLGAFPVTRGAGDMSAVQMAVDVIHREDVFAIFPEGTRSKDGKLRRLKTGAIYIASETKADIVPAVVHLKEFDKGLHFRTPITVRFGKPIPHEEIKISREDRSSMRLANTRLAQAMQELIDQCEVSV